MLHFGAVDYRATVWVNGHLRGRARRRPHAVFRRHHQRARRVDGKQTVTVYARRRSARPGQAARQAGLAARAALDLVSAHHRHLADGLDRAGAAHLHPEAALDARSSKTSKSAARCSRAATSEDRPVRRSQDLARRKSAGGRPCTSCSATRPTARSPCPTPASTIRATSCCGARSGRRCSTPRITLRRGDACSTRSRSYTALRSVAINARPLHAQRPAVPLRLVLDQGYWPKTA